MAAEDAVLVAATARNSVRDSLDRMAFHLARGKRGALGVSREVEFLDGLSREATRLGGGTQVGKVTTATQGLGSKAKAALSGGNSATIGRAKSSLLATFSDDTMYGARSWTYTGGNMSWVWQANGSACAACLSNHGSTYFGSMYPEHPSCLCFPVNPVNAGHISALSDKQLLDVLRSSNNPAFRAQANLVDRGGITVRDAINNARRPSTRLHYAKTLRRLESGVTGLSTDAGATVVATAAPVAAPTEKSISWMSEWEASGKLKLNAKTSRQLLDDALAIVEERIAGMPHLRKGFDEAADYFSKVSAVNKPIADDGSRTLGVVKRWWKRFDPDEITIRTELQLDVARLDTSAIKAYNVAWRQYGDDYFFLRKQADRFRFADEVRYRGVLDELKALEKTKPTKRSLKRAATPEEIADTWIHEMTHAWDTNGILSDKLLADGMKEEYRRIASTGKYQDEFAYGAELTKDKQGRETLAEMVRMYTSGFRESGVNNMTAEVWRETYPTLAEWVEKNVLVEGAI